MKAKSRAIIVFVGLLGATFAYGLMERMQIRLNLKVFAFQEIYPAPHTLPRFEGQTGLRLAMIHDVLHERYPIHSQAYWEARAKPAKELLSSVKALEGKLETAPSKELLSAFDEYGVCLDKLKRSDEAVQILRKKLAIQQQFFPNFQVNGEGARNLSYETLSESRLNGKEISTVEDGFYQTHVNLGTFLIHGALEGAFSGDQSIKENLEKGRDHLRKSMIIKPRADFTRESWLLVMAQQLIQALDNGDQWYQYTALGGILTDFPLDRRGRLIAPGRSSTSSFEQHRDHESAPEGNLTIQDRSRIREPIKRLKLQQNIDRVQRFVTKEVSFDEPVLGIIGMWTSGCGANPHLSLALACLIDSFRQPYIAWAAFERTKLLVQSYGETQEDRDFIAKLCSSRQILIEEKLSENREQLKEQFNEELAFGRSFQKDYQDYEVRCLKEGLKPNSPGFYDKFFKGREDIASEAGSEDSIAVTKWLELRKFLNKLPILLLGFGFGAFLASFASGREGAVVAEQEDRRA